MSALAQQPEALLEEALGQVVGELSHEWRKDLERISAESRAFIAELKMQNAELQASLKDGVAQALERIAEAAASLKDGEPGRDGKDGAPGQDADPEVIKAMVAEALAALPVPKDGAPGIDGKDGADGKDGRDGIDGKDGAPGLDGKDGAPGQDGKDADPETIKAMVTEAVAVLPPAKDGRDGKDGVDGINGKDADPALIEDMVTAAVAKAVEAIPVLKGDKGADGKDGAPGAPGRDGVGLAGVFRDDAGGLVVTLSNGEVKALGPMPGQKMPESDDATLAEEVPDGLADTVAKGAKLLAEAPLVIDAVAPPQPIVMNIAPPPAVKRQTVRKTITTRKDENGNLVADVVEQAD